MLNKLKRFSWALLLPLVVVGICGAIGAARTVVTGIDPLGHNPLAPGKPWHIVTLGDYFGFSPTVCLLFGLIGCLGLATTMIMWNYALRHKLIAGSLLLKDVRHSLHATRQHMEKLVSSNPVGVFEADNQGAVTYISPNGLSILGMSEAESLGLGWSEGLHPEDKPGAFRAWQAAFATQETYQYEHRFFRSNGHMIWLSCQAFPVKNLADETVGYLGSFTDISEQKAAAERIAFLAYHDPLTELPNRLLMKERFAATQAHADRTHQQMAMLLIDLDHFKTINDTLGHPVGDLVLKHVAKSLASCVSDRDTISRPGGDEFVVLLDAIERADDITRAAEAMIEAAAQPMMIDGNELSTSISVGIALYPSDGDDFDTLFRNADTAMYQAKEAGRNTYRFFAGEMNANAVEHLKLRSGLKKALARNEFVLHYQPQIDLASGQIVGVEALIRWNHPERGMISPLQFIPIAETTGLIVPIGEWVLREACRQAKQWEEAGLELVVAINLSALQFKRGGLEQTVMQVLAETGLDSNLLELELTESILIQDTENVLATVRQLKSLGIGLSIDDFGTGYSSLAYLSRLAVDKLKIDQSFVRNLIENPENAAIVRAIIQMARSLNLRTIAEGVETEQVATRLGILHCNEAQGYYFARPMPAEELAAFVRKTLPDRNL